MKKLYFKKLILIFIGLGIFIIQILMFLKTILEAIGGNASYSLYFWTMAIFFGGYIVIDIILDYLQKKDL